jgi:KDO2-lipid IV(A) lauroyltransferase
MMVDSIYLFLYKFFTLLSKLVPLWMMHGTLRGMAYIAYYVKRKSTRIIFTNLDLAFHGTLNHEKKRAIALRVYYNLAQTIVGFMRRKGLSREALLENVVFENEEILLDALREKRKILFVTGHYSNWELLPPVIAAKYGITLVGVGRKLDSEVMDRVLLENREQFGVEMIYRKGAMKGAIKSLKEGKALGFLVDQSLGEKQGGIKVDFFNHAVGHSPAVSVLARTFETDMIPAFISTEDYEHYKVTFYTPLPYLKTEDKEGDIVKMTQAQADIMQEVITHKPEEWFWVHKRWKVFYPELYKKCTK